MADGERVRLPRVRRRTGRSPGVGDRVQPLPDRRLGVEAIDARGHVGRPKRMRKDTLQARKGFAGSERFVGGQIALAGGRRDVHG